VITPSTQSNRKTQKVTCALGRAARAAIRIKPVTLTVKVPRYRVRTPVTG
jgi:hypothetical protein